MQKLSFSNIVSLVLIFLFSYTAVSKIFQFDYFTAQLSLFAVLGKAPVFYALLIIAAEIITAALLFVPGTRIAGLFASLLLLFIFTVYLFVMIITIPHLPCTCGGIISKMTWQQHIIFNCACLLLNTAGIFLYRYPLYKNNKTTAAAKRINSLLQ